MNGSNDIAARMLDRIAELGKGNEERTLDYIMNSDKPTSAERQAALIQRRTEAGQNRVTVWAAVSDLDALRAKYPGQRGGIDWQSIIDKALGRKVKR